MTLMKLADAFTLSAVKARFFSIRERVHDILESIRWEAVEPDQILLVVQIWYPALCFPWNEDDSALLHSLIYTVDFHHTSAL